MVCVVKLKSRQPAIIRSKAFKFDFFFYNFCQGGGKKRLLKQEINKKKKLILNELRKKEQKILEAGDLVDLCCDKMFCFHYVPEPFKYCHLVNSFTFREAKLLIFQWMKLDF